MLHFIALGDRFYEIGNRLFAILEKQGITVSGGRIDGVGVGGFLLGGGYSYLTDEVSLLYYGLFSNRSGSPNLNLFSSQVCLWIM